MRNYTMSIEVSINANSDEEALKIRDNVIVVVADESTDLNGIETLDSDIWCMQEDEHIIEKENPRGDMEEEEVEARVIFNDREI